MKNQGKTSKQYKDSMMLFYIAAIGLSVVMLVATILQWPI